MTLRSSAAWAGFALIGLLTGCSGSDSGADSFETGSLEAFSSYCVGTLNVTLGVAESSGPGAWHYSSTMPKVGAGTPFLVASDWNKWEGYVLGEDGTPRKLHTDHDTGLVRDQFTSSCATDDKLTDWGRTVLLADATFYPNSDLSGEPCTIPIATELTSYGFASGMGGSATVSAEQIKTTCGLDDAYTVDYVYGELVAK